MSRAGRRTTPSARRRAAAVAVAGSLVGAACASTAPDVAPLVNDVPETVGLGRFPEPFSESAAAVPSTIPVADTTSPTTTTTAVPVPVPESGAVGEVVTGNRVLVIGDTVLASTAPRHGGAMCEVFEAFGWHGEIAAEFGRFIDFGRVVVDDRVTTGESDWDVAAVMFGNHFNGDLTAFRIELDELLTSLSPRPIILYTVAEDDSFHAEINEVVRAVPDGHPNVIVLDFAEIVAAEPDVLLAESPSGLSDEGLGRLALFTVATLGEAPPGDTPGCGEPFFVDDSAIVI